VEPNVAPTEVVQDHHDQVGLLGISCGSHDGQQQRREECEHGILKPPNSRDFGKEREIGLIAPLDALTYAKQDRRSPQCESPSSRVNMSLHLWASS
jgi:hypothetical protein